MRRFAPFLLLALVAAACGGNDGLSKGAAATVATRAQLTAADLGPGWKKTADTKPDASGSSDKQLQSCGKDLEVAGDTIAESNTRTFEKTAGDVDQQHIVVSSEVLTSKDRADQLYRTIASDRFATCIAKAFADELKASSDAVTVVAGNVELRRDELKAADHSARITAGFTLKVDQTDLPGQVDLVTASTGQVFSLLFGFSLGTPIGADRLVHLGGVLVSRQKA